MKVLVLGEHNNTPEFCEDFLNLLIEEGLPQKITVIARDNEYGHFNRMKEEFKLLGVIFNLDFILSARNRDVLNVS